jgi:NAD+ kinase
MRTVGLVPHRDRESAHGWARAAAQWFGAEDVVVRIPKEEARAVDLPELGVAPDEFLEGLDLVVSLGGDGTMLHAVDLVYPAPVPILGVNIGQLGYLTEVEPEELEASMPRLLAGDFTVLERMVLSVDVDASGLASGRWFALNEAALEKQRSGHLIRLDVSINGSAFTTYAADGVIVATPTGTTAYSFSVRGPIASPALRCLVLTPVSPHMLFDRSLVLADQEELGFVVRGERGNVVLTVDGRELGELVPGDRVAIRAASEPVRLASLRPRDFHQVLKAKFDLPDR